MNTQYPTTDIKALEASLKEKQLQSEETGKKDLLFDQIKRLYFGMKELNQRLEKFFQVSNLELHQ